MFKTKRYIIPAILAFIAAIVMYGVTPAGATESRALEFVPYAEAHCIGNITMVIVEVTSNSQHTNTITEPNPTVINPGEVKVIEIMGEATESVVTFVYSYHIGNEYGRDVQEITIPGKQCEVVPPSTVAPPATTIPAEIGSGVSIINDDVYVGTPSTVEVPELTEAPPTTIQTGERLALTGSSNDYLLEIGGALLLLGSTLWLLHHAWRKASPSDS